MTYYGSRNFEAAAANLKLASAQQPDNAELRYKLAQSYLWSKQYPEAIAEFQAALRPASTAVEFVEFGQCLTYGELDRRVPRVPRFLLGCLA